MDEGRGGMDPSPCFFFYKKCASKAKEGHFLELLSLFYRLKATMGCSLATGGALIHSRFFQQTLVIPNNPRFAKEKHAETQKWF